MRSYAFARSVLTTERIWRYRAILFPCLAEARCWFVVHRVYQLGTYVNPVYTLIWAGFALPFPSRPPHCCIPPVVLRIISVERQVVAD